MISWWEKLFTPSTPFLMTNSDEPFEHGELPDSRLPLVLRDSHEIRYRNSPLVNRMIGLCLRNRNTFESPLPNLPRDDRLEAREINNNKAPLPPPNDSARGEFD